MLLLLIGGGTGGAPEPEPEPTTSTRVIYWGDYIENLRAHAQSLRDQVITDDEDDDWLLM